MQLRTKALDCLYLNWALPRDVAPPLPPGLRYEVHTWRDGEWVFVSALLFRLAGLHLRSLPFLRLSYPQMNLRVYVLDEQGRPSVLFRRMMVPFWVAPVSRFLARQPATSARLRFPPLADRPDSGARTWRIDRGRRFEVSARPGSPLFGQGPDLGSWQSTVDHFRQRPRGYVYLGGRLRSLRTFQPRLDVVPLAVDLHAVDLLAEGLTPGHGELWQSPHSAWLCPEIPFGFEVGRPIALPLPRRRVPAAESCRTGL